MFLSENLNPNDFSNFFVNNLEFFIFSTPNAPTLKTLFGFSPN